MTFITPRELARELGHDDAGKAGRKVRAYLRSRYTDHQKNASWFLTPEQADDVREHFGARPRG